MPYSCVAMATPEAEGQAARNAAIVALAAKDLAPLWPRVDWDSPDAVTAVKTIYRAVVTRYGQVSASSAALFYDDLRTRLELPTRYTAVTAEVLPDAVLNHAVESAFLGRVEVTEHDDHEHEADTTSSLPVEQRVPTRLGNKLQRHVQQAGRDTIALNATADPATAVIVRVPQGAKTCAFCIMLASRAIDIGFSGYSTQSVKWSEELGRNIHVTTGRGRTPVASRTGKRPLGETYHNECDCEPMPVFPGQDHTDVSPNFGDYQDKYYKAAADAGTHSDTKKILASMRQLYGVK